MRKKIQRWLDGPVEASEARALEAHLAECRSCRDYLREIEAIRGALRSMPRHRFPDEALEQVWSRTVRSDAAARSRTTVHWSGWRPLAAAAVVALGLAGLWLAGWRRPAEPPVHDRVEIARAAAELKLVLGRTAHTIRQAETTAIGGVLANEVSPALQRIPIQLGPSDQANRRSGT